MVLWSWKQGLLADSCFSISLAAQGWAAPPLQAPPSAPSPACPWNPQTDISIDSCHPFKGLLPCHTHPGYCHLPIKFQVHSQFALVCGVWWLASQGSWARGKSGKAPGKDGCSETCSPVSRAWRDIPVLHTECGGWRIRSPKA